MKSKRKFSLKQQYKESWDYLKQSQWFIYSAIIFFAISFLLGFFINPPTEVLNYISEFIQNLLDKTQDLSAIGLISFIFLNNLSSSFFGMVLGITLGVFPFLAIFVNGYLLGFVSSITVAEQGFSNLWRLLPHGIFELPAIFLSLGMGLKIGSFILQKDRTKSLREYLFNSFRVFLFIVIPLLIIAGIIEGLLISLGI